MKKLILLLVALPLLLTNCGKESQPEGPTNTTTTYKGIYTTPSSSTEGTEVPAVIVVTENSSTEWSLSLQVQGQTPQVIVAAKNGDILEVTKQTFQNTVITGQGGLYNSGAQLRLVLEATDNTTTSGVTFGSFLGEKQ